MEDFEKELIERYIDKDDELRRCVAEHRELDRIIEELSKQVKTLADDYEVKRLKKVKLLKRDKLKMIIKRYMDMEKKL